MHKKTIRIGLIVVIGLTLVLFVTLTSGNDGAGDSLTQEEVESGLDLQKNGANGTYTVNLISGDFGQESEGKVLNDTDCTPDEEGISRCHNDIELVDSDKEVTIVNPHNMKNNRCLRPGETVHLSRSQNGKVTVKLMEF
ncbi:hypothetical protein SAMN05216232_3805 [Virgibacillus subterraneus]|uniref:FHA domain-containing protein n=1 Tax=Virgibacillus subterraneus TaxID=621109 RepID=A0A1H9KAI0_9BACI|nr:hypothetical protein [Virgibacillus subterraneus]SEQ95865.1 hypothetical protein SAMN05216232_3805 [Virgibacillus subterraneus]